MDLAALVDNRVSAHDGDELRAGQRRVFEHAITALNQLVPKGEHDHELVVRAEIGWCETCARDKERILVGAPFYAWVLAALRTRVVKPTAPLPPLELGQAVKVPWPGPSPVYRLDHVRAIETRLTTEAVFFNSIGTCLTPRTLSDSRARDKWTADLSAALRALEKYLPAFAPVYSQFVQYHVPLDVGVTAEESYGVSITCRDAPGVIGFSPMLPLALVGTLVHECRHNLLYAVQELDPLVLDSEALVRSPWRADPRPLGGLLHGAFVFDGICRLYAKIVVDDGLSARNHRAAAKHFREQALNLQEALTTLKSASEFTRAGRTLVEILDSAAVGHLEQSARAIEGEGIIVNTVGTS